jgi:hypothetical protein
MPGLSAMWVDSVRLAFASLVPGIEEGYVPAQHDTGWMHPLAALQAACHDLAAEGVRGAKPSTYPFPTVLSGLALLYRGDRLVVHLGHTLDHLQLAAAPTAWPGARALELDKTAGLVWSDMVTACQLSASALRAAFWIRAASGMFQADSDILRCPHCRQACTNWGTHCLSNAQGELPIPCPVPHAPWGGRHRIGSKPT